MENKAFAGIGSRATPKEIESTIEEILIFMNKLGYVMRSGGASGADSMFEVYAKNKEIYLPWRGFNNNGSDLYLDNIERSLVQSAMDIAKEFHPNWQALSNAAKLLMTRNTFQILGKNLDSPVQLVICWTEGGQLKGGTSQAIRIAKSLDIPIFNLYHKDSLHKIKLYINSLC